MARRRSMFAPRRRQSLKGALGLTTAKRRVKKQLGISAVQQAFSPSAQKRKAKRAVGYYSGPSRALRWIANLFR